ncbi:EAL domain-containing protein [Aquamicrobium sp. LC103]|uniref:EAL domain-containing protein n=1 Tax=Aquamicrobium sp. LC103 TaxID=1120658 RepID=UPI00063ED0C2|nr:EAL domain-containing protein [Aquamicrobium sp. LC103]TKT80375.1 EAL domain-containing protein [Aquamicrobium sp. LC103]
MYHFTEIDDLIAADEVGIETGLLGEFRLKTAYEPIFRRQGQGFVPFGVKGQAKPFLQGRPSSMEALFRKVSAERRRDIDLLCRALCFRNHRNIGVDGLRLFFGFGPATSERVDEVLGGLDRIAGDLADIEIAPELMVCEIAEGGMADRDAPRRLADGLRGIGMGIAVREFGSGPSNFDAVRQVSPDIVALGSAWFRRIAENEQAVRLLSVLVSGLKAEGAEVLIDDIATVRQFEIALEVGADLVKGPALRRAALVGTVFDETPLDAARILRQDANIVPLFGRSRAEP